jgi:ferredoxin--NADP+ reductase
MAKREPNAICTQRIEITSGLIKMRVIPDGWQLPDFVPGQFAALGLPAKATRSSLAEPEENPTDDPEKYHMRAYSIASSSIAKESLEFYVGLVKTGALSSRLFSLKPGDKLWMSEKFRGMFTLSQVPEDHNIVLVATGTGVAPYMSMIRTEINTGLKRRIAVFHGAYHSTDLGYHSELKTLDSMSDNFTYLPTLSHAHEEATPWNGHEGFVQKLWTDGVLDRAWGFHPKPENTHVFLCGNPYMIDDMTELLVGEGFVLHSKKTPGQLHAEQYYVKKLSAA